jgi:hypothetical protein
MQTHFPFTIRPANQTGHSTVLIVPDLIPVFSERNLTRSWRSKPSGGADLRVSRGLVEIHASAAQQHRPTKDNAKMSRFFHFHRISNCGVWIESLR